MEEKLAAIKLITGEEIICNVIDISKDNTMLQLRDVYTLSIEYSRRGIPKFSLLPWFFLNADKDIELSVANIITMTQVEDPEIREAYLEIVHTNNKSLPPAPSSKDELGYIGSVTDYKKILERLYTDIDAVEPPRDI